MSSEPVLLSTFTCRAAFITETSFWGTALALWQYHLRYNSPKYFSLPGFGSLEPDRPMAVTAENKDLNEAA
jgi:hypothetical protein